MREEREGERGPEREKRESERGQENGRHRKGDKYRTKQRQRKG